MKTDANGNEVYFGYTLVKPERKGDLWRIVNAAQTTVDSATTRSEARSAVKRTLDNGPQSTATYCADTDGEHDYHPEDGGKRCNGCGYWVESLEPGEGYKPTVADPIVEPDAHTIDAQHVAAALHSVDTTARASLRALVASANPHAIVAMQEVAATKPELRVIPTDEECPTIDVHAAARKALAPALARTGPPKPKPGHTFGPQTILFRLDGGVACGVRTSGIAGELGETRILSSQRSPRRIGEVVVVYPDDELTVEQVETYRKTVKEARKARRAGFALTARV